MKILTHKTTLVPAELFSAEEAPHYLELCGLPATASERVVWSKPTEGMVAVMAADRLSVEQCPEGENFTSPLLEGPTAMEGPTLRLTRYGTLLYVKLYNPTLQLAEVLRAECDEDLHYYASTLRDMLPTKRCRLQVEGEAPERLLKVVKPYFK